MLDHFHIKIFADGADLKGIEEMSRKEWIQGFTTNPTLMRHAGVKDYKSFAQEAIALAGAKPISFEVFADEFSEMEEQALEIASWGSRVYVKIPVTNTKGESSHLLIRRLSRAGVSLNITAVLTWEQVQLVAESLHEKTPAILSVFAGRIADTGRDPLVLMRKALQKIPGNVELLWASTREFFNLIQANEIGCHIITMTHDLLKKIPLLGKDLKEYSLETVQMFYRDAKAAAYAIDCKVVQF